MTVKKLIKVRRYKAGYEVREELHDGSNYGTPDMIMKSSYTLSGDYIGDSRWGYTLCKKRGIAPEKVSKEHAVCSIGYCKKERKWYGWSHRALYGFSSRSRVKKGDCGFAPKNRKEFLEGIKRWHSGETGKYTYIFKKLKTGVKIIPKAKEKIHNVTWKPWVERYPQKWGRGEWQANNIADAKQMAVDFARGVS